MARDPLTERFARTLRETARDPYDWWEGRRERPLLWQEREPWHRFDGLVIGALVLGSLAGAGLVAWALWWLMTL